MTQQEQRAVYEKIEEVKDSLRDKMDERFDQIRESISDLKDYVHKNNHIKVEVEKNTESISECTGLLKEHLTECKVRDTNRKMTFKRKATIYGLVFTAIGLVISVVMHII